MSAWRGRAAPVPGLRRLGVEHEFQLLDGRGQVDARRLLPTLPIDGRRLDPGDRHAVRCRWGGVITADGREAEIATPPVSLGDRGIDAAAQMADDGAAALKAALPPGTSMRGYSTHLNVEVDDRRCVRITRLIAERMAPAMMLLLDRTDSPGLLVRPRYRRLELGGEYQRAQALRACLAMAAGIVLVADAAVSSRRARRVLPPRLRLDIVRCPQRFGWYVDRRAGGADLYRAGRSTRLRTVDGQTVAAQDVLTRTWSAARPLLEGIAERVDLGAVDDLVTGLQALPCERNDEIAAASPRLGAPVVQHRDVLAVRHRRGVDITTASATWHAVVFRAEHGGSRRWINVPGEHLDGFLDALDGGELDEWLVRLLAEPATLGERLRRLRSLAST